MRVGKSNDFWYRRRTTGEVVQYPNEAMTSSCLNMLLTTAYFKGFRDVLYAYLKQALRSRSYFWLWDKFTL